MSEGKRIQNCNLQLIQQDITDFEVEAFVFYAEPNLALGSGFGSAIARRGGTSIKAELDKIGSVALTDAIVTAGGSLKAKHIVHAVGPTFQEAEIEQKLRVTIVNALKRAEEKGIRQIALPLMGAGFYAIPLDTCTQIMMDTIREYLSKESNLSEIFICANDPREYRAFQKVLKAVPANSAGA
jgi:O-acetyl-ADP-ribose deacetylase (regulator of RNase III)